VFLLNVTLKAGGQLNDLPPILNGLYDRILFTVSNEEKLRLNDSVQLVVGQYAASDRVFESSFQSVRFLGQILSSDKRIKILTWNLMLRDGTNHYFCYLIRKGKRGKENSVHFLKGIHQAEAPSSGRIYSEDDWYGALYYAAEPCKKDYILLGLDFGDMESRKIIDVLKFDKTGRITLGKDFFSRDDKKLFRDVIEYSSESIVSLRFIKPGLIVFDQLAAISGSGDDDSEPLGAYGILYDGYVYKRGTWKFTSGIDARNARK
jgi:hypothetical protein